MYGKATLSFMEWESQCDNILLIEQPEQDDRNERLEDGTTYYVRLGEDTIIKVDQKDDGHWYMFPCDIGSGHTRVLHHEPGYDGHIIEYIGASDADPVIGTTREAVR